MSHFRAVVLDYDGTLFDTRPAIVHCIARAFAATGRAVPASGVIAATVGTGTTLPDTLIVLDERLRGDRIALDEMVGLYRTVYLAEAAAFVMPYGGVGDALRRLHAGAIQCLVVSNKGIAAIRQSLDASGFTPFIDAVFGDQPGVPNKPDPAIMTELILPRCAPVTMAQIVVVGDTETDIVFAKAAGAASCWASYGYGDKERCMGLAPDHVIGRITELPNLVLSS
jgi:phosphoglycolate phosphatase